MNGYFDYAAATPMDPRVLEAMQPFFIKQFHNPSALYGPAVEAKKAMDAARSTIAQIIGAKPSEIIFTAGGTEANNIAIQGIMKQFPEATMLYSAIEHDSVRRIADHYKSEQIKVNDQGVIAVPEDIADDAVLISVMYANNEIGSVQPIKELSQRIQQVRRQRVDSGNTLPLYLHTDAAQAGNYLDLHVSRLGIDLMTVNGGKIYGPKQSGFLYIKSGVQLEPILYGGGQERALRSGTENLAHAVGLAKALGLSDSLRNDELIRMKALQKRLLDGVQSFATINGSTKRRLPNNVHVTIPNIDNERALLTLDMDGIYAASGSACSASHDEPSHVLQALGLQEVDIRSSLRFTMGRQTTEGDVDALLQALQRIIR